MEGLTVAIIDCIRAAEAMRDVLRNQPKFIFIARDDTEEKAMRILRNIEQPIIPTLEELHQDDTKKPLSRREHGWYRQFDKKSKRKNLR